ncbi:hypothetical protein PI124_g7417 [Phytophthora idaei]|nr:hypothetical protein PI125_g10925 [Phytophthora idaei]KAG3144810.1 hypothetical protein PI126_g13994 [Phytophthora idaei]KAG3247885.1 hypothetical protein PI124_g7417 [Phytophthora idaei]
MNLICLHFTDAESSEPLETLQELFRDNYESNRDAVNSLLLTATMWNMESCSDNLPLSGAIITISDYSNLKLFRETNYQMTIELRDLTWGNQP